MGILSIAFAFGFTLMVLVYAIGPISGCHINPAVTIAMMVAKKIGVQDGIAYMVTQIIGALLASALKNDADWTIGVLHPVYTYELRVEGATRESLLNDLN